MKTFAANLLAGAIALSTAVASPLVLAADDPGTKTPFNPKAPASSKAPSSSKSATGLRPSAGSNAMGSPKATVKTPIPKLQLDAGKKWATDEPLRRGMSAIYDATRKSAAALNDPEAKPAVFVTLGKQVEGEVGRIVKECKLPEDADKQLHFIVADLVAGADLLKAAEDATAGRAGLGKVSRALRMYGVYFDHPGWRARH